MLKLLPFLRLKSGNKVTDTLVIVNKNQKEESDRREYLFTRLIGQIHSK